MFLAKLESEIKQYQLFNNGEKILVGVSGGTDSIALLHGLVRLAPEYRWQIHVVHVNHQLRGEASDQDADYVAKFCEKYQIPYQIKKVDVQAKRAEDGGNKQAIARQLRYRAFQAVAQEQGIKKLTLAHHADDQVETMVMRLIRGTGPSGLVGMKRIRVLGSIQVVRPLLRIYRKEMEDYLEDCQIVPREDESNQSTLYTRNRLRLELIPDLMSYNPHVKQALLQLGSLIEEEEEVWQKWTNEGVASISTKVSEQEYLIDIKSFLSYPVALQRRMVKLILNCLTDENLPYHSIEQVLQLVVHPSPSVWIFLPGGIKGVRSYEKLRLTKDYINKAEAEWIFPLQIPGITYLPQGAIQSIISSTPFHSDTRESPHKAVFDAEQLDLAHLSVRNRRAGDRIRPYGFSGHKQVKALFMEKKIPLSQRNKQPIVVVKDEIVWIPNIRRSAIAPVTPETSRFLMLQWLEK
ncbi:tRNA lysidine(34) synthetase TilS [Shimazuella alba]|uniref:tRNA(Ile)-lysidine synthase n=1 Tax=Shimazuella alba TaxID=2690964 RepID=A0A6I4VS23_9BACL|nr:tRNA lysidine(34) synthetase TilS [Shimazuella alba]MXQ54539.1 tRNA lysidine(34) synthetase TilS [Shimazuella alba]